MSIESEAASVPEEEQQSLSGRDDEGSEGAPAGSVENEEEGEFEDEEEAGANALINGNFGHYSATSVNEQVFEELALGAEIASEVQDTWHLYLEAAESRDAAGEAIYSALFDAAPSLQTLFKTPRAVMALRFMNGLNQIINAVHDPKALKILVETLGFQHLDLEVTTPRVEIFRDAIVELVLTELGERMTPAARIGWCAVLNYVGGAYIYVRVQYAERLKCLGVSWAMANGTYHRDLDEGGSGEHDAAGAGNEAAGASAELHKLSAAVNGGKDGKSKKASKSAGKSWFAGKSASGSGGKGGEGGSGEAGLHNTSVPKTFKDMFQFNAAVMGFGGQTWMMPVLESFDAIVTNVSNSFRLQEECDVLALRMSRFQGNITLTQYKSVMLASLRSLVKDWGSLHEISWSWLWDNVERMLMALMGKPLVQEHALSAFLSSLDESSLMMVRREVYAKFFALSPAGQEYFKQSTTRLHFIADKVLAMTLDMYRDPRRMVEDISALGLRHVGYGIPTDLFGSFVSACVQVVRMLTDDDMAVEAFRWSLNLVSRILTRVINEGSTLVMRAINANSQKQLRKAVACAPRGVRALWVLNVQVGTQSISPLMWAIETGSLDAAKSIILDLLTIRADRDRYYFGMDTIFERHPDIVKRLCADAPALLPAFLNGLVWRSRVTENGKRRVNYYIKNFVVDAHGEFSPALEWLSDHGDPKIVCHPLIEIVTDMIWNRVAFRSFFIGKAWFLFTTLVFIMSQSVLNKLETQDSTDPNAATIAVATGNFLDTYQESPLGVRVAIVVCRIFIYVFSLGVALMHHSKKIVACIRERNFFRFGPLRIPEYLNTWQECIRLALALVLLTMLALEPLIHCVDESKGDHRFTEHCNDGEKVLFSYSIMSTTGMLMYFLLLSDMSVLSTRVSAFALVCSKLVIEVALFLGGLTFFVITFACSISSLEQDNPDFAGIPLAALNLYRITFGMFAGHYDVLTEYPALMVAIFIYVVTTIIFLTNLLIGQLNCAYQVTYQDMLGFARLNRAKIVHTTIPMVPASRWHRFVEGMRFDERIEFGEGDIGVAGGVQVFEPASANITTVDMIRRFGGSTSAGAQWPEDDAAFEEVDRFERMEKLLERAMKRMASNRKKASNAGSSMGGSSFLGSSMFSGIQQSSSNDASQ